MIDVTGVDLVKFAQKVYELSAPQGLGVMHFTPRPLTDEDAKSMISSTKYPLDMDYVSGRACKMTVIKRNDKLEIGDSWYDHTDSQFKELLDTFGIAAPSLRLHNRCCNCADCR